MLNAQCDNTSTLPALDSDRRTPQAYPTLNSSSLSTLSAQLAAMIVDHFIPQIPPLPILPPTKYFVPHLHLTLLSSSGGSVPTALCLAARAAFIDLRIPRTRVIGWEGTRGGGGGSGAGAGEEGGEGEGEDHETDLSGIKAALKAGRGRKGKGREVMRGGEDWDLDLEGGGGGDGTISLEKRDELPVLVSLNLVSLPDFARWPVSAL